MFHTIISFYCNLSCRFEKFWANAYEVINSLDARMAPFSWVNSMTNKNAQTAAVFHFKMKCCFQQLFFFIVDVV